MGSNDALERALELIGKDGTPLQRTRGEDSQMSLRSGSGAQSALARCRPDELGIDIYLGMDATGSMTDKVEVVREDLKTVTDNLLQDGNNRLSVIGIRDHGCGEKLWLEMYPLGKNQGEIRRALNSLTITGEGNSDIPEAYECFALELAKRIPRESPGRKRAVILVGDSIPHGMNPPDIFDGGCPRNVDYRAAFDGMKALADCFYFVGCDPHMYDLQQRLVDPASKIREEKFIPLDGMVHLLPELIVGMGKRIQSPQAYETYLRALQRSQPKKGAQLAGLLGSGK